MFSIKIDNQEIGEIVKVVNVERGSLPTIKNRIKEYSLVDGVRFQGQSYGSREMRISFVVTSDIDEKHEALKKILSANKVFNVIFGDYPNRYWKCIINGGGTFEKRNGKYATGEIELLSLYPYSFSTGESLARVDGNKLTFTNEGTAEAFPRFEFVAEDNYKMFGFVDKNGNSVQFGYERNENPFIRIGQKFVYDSATNECYVDNKRKYLSEGKPFSIKSGSTTEIATSFFPQNSPPVVKGYVRGAFY